MTTDTVVYRAKCPACGNLDARYVCETVAGPHSQRSQIARIDCTICDSPTANT